MFTYQIDYDCFWKDTYPTPRTCGTFTYEAENIHNVCSYLWIKWIHSLWFKHGTFIISCKETDEILVIRQ